MEAMSTDADDVTLGRVPWTSFKLTDPETTWGAVARGENTEMTRLFSALPVMELEDFVRMYLWESYEPDGS
jgi:hypothetical protein